VALGVDRLVMLALGAEQLGDVIAFTVDRAELPGGAVAYPAYWCYPHFANIKNCHFLTRVFFLICLIATIFVWSSATIRAV
jgi:hypothetical protein